MAIIDNALIERTIRIVEDQTPELAPGCMAVPLSYYRDEDQAARGVPKVERRPHCGAFVGGLVDLQLLPHEAEVRAREALALLCRPAATETSA